MTILLRVYLPKVLAAIILQQVSCAKLGTIPLIGNKIDVNTLQNDTSKLKYTTIENSKEKQPIGELNTETNKRTTNVPNILHSSSTISTRINTPSGMAKIDGNTNNVSRTNGKYTTNISNDRYTNFIHSSFDSLHPRDNNSNYETAKLVESTENGKNELFNKPIQTNESARYARAGDTPPGGQSVLQPEGYIYDLNHCQYVDNRVLCGYDKNPEPPKKKEIVDLDDLCRKHGDRIECGYVTGPYPDVYNLDPAKDKILSIDLAKYYNNIVRSGHEGNDSDSDYDMALRTREMPSLLLLELLSLREDVAKLTAALPANISFTSVNVTAPPTFNTTPIPTSTIPASTIPITKETEKKSEPHIDLAEILQSKISKLRLNDLMAPIFTSTTVKSEHIGQKKCVEKDGRIFCRTI